MNKRIIYLSIGLIIMLTIVSCKRKGCTNMYCGNYEEKAKKDDGSCDCKTGTISMYIKKDVGEVYVTLAEDTLGKINYFFSNETPLCGQQGTLTVQLETGDYQVTAESILGTTWQKSFSITEGQCSLLLIE